MSYRLLNQNKAILVFFALVLALLLTGCTGSGPMLTVAAEEAAPSHEIAAAPLPGPAETVAVSLNPQVMTSDYQAGSLVKTVDDPGVFWVTSDGHRRHIYDWDTYLNFGFKPDSILTISAADLRAMPVGDELTRLTYDQTGRYYWAVVGSLWAIEDWQPYLSGTGYQGSPATPIDPLLLEAMPHQASIPDYVVLRDGDTYYMQTPDLLYQLAGATIYYAFGYGDEQLIDVPIGVLAEANSPSPELTQFLQAAGLPFGQTPLYQMIDGRRQAITPAQLQQAGYRQTDVTAVSATFLNRLPAATSLLISSPEVNLRQGPGTGYEVIGQAKSGQELLPVARTQDNSWFEVSDQGRSAWVAASVTHFNGDLSSLPQAELAVLDAAITATPTVEPVAAVVAEVTPVKLVCDEVPIRGFGQIWADHPEIQATLGCPYTFEGGEQGTSAAVQRFEHGWMVWVAQDQVYNGDPVYVFFEDDSAFQRFGDLGPADPAKMGQTKAGFYPVGDQFSKVYWEGTGARVKERLGNAVSEAEYSAGAFQNFWQGRMLWVDEVERIFVVYDYSYYDEAASVTQYVKVWGVYKDTF